MTEANLMESERFKMCLVIVGGDGDEFITLLRHIYIYIYSFVLINI